MDPSWVNRSHGAASTWHAVGVGWLLRDGEVLASIEIAATRRDRRRGLLGRDSLEGALVFPKTRWVHTLGMRFAIDVAFLSPDGDVVKLVTMQPHRLGVPLVGARTVLEAEAGAFGRWGLQLGDRLEVRNL
jgi:uncharacterized membrane protein (UPF0127 family)